VSPDINILVVDDDEMYRQTYSLILSQKGYNVSVAVDGGSGLEKFKAGSYNIVFVDYRMPDMDGIEFLRQARSINKKVDIVLITAFSSVETAVEAIKLGAFDYLDKPASRDKLTALVEKIIERQRLLFSTRDNSINLSMGDDKQSIIGESPKMREIFDIIAKIAPTDSTVLILGESGTGKEVIAKAIHENSLRKQRPFFTMDCGALVESLVESELFGHIKGSFTGASATKHGAFELAHTGTFFFDEIGNISTNVQAKVLRAIQEKEIRRVGGTDTINVDVRVIAATNLDLFAAVQDGRFREDLYYRLSVIPIYLPPLRDRPTDIPLLVDYFMQKFSQKNQGQHIKGITDHALDTLLHYHWPGNIRELQNVIERASVIEEDSVIHWDSLPAHARGEVRGKPEEIGSLRDIEKNHIEKVLLHTEYNISQAARILKIDRKTLYDKIKKYDLN
jgi:DNA-binding NtrC family response regulator